MSIHFQEGAAMKTSFKSPNVLGSICSALPITIDRAALAQSRCIRLGVRIIHLTSYAQFIESPGAILFLLVSSSLDAFAQLPNGNIVGSDQQVGNAIREAIKWGRNLLCSASSSSAGGS
jgi:hypothetical protein